MDTRDGHVYNMLGEGDDPPAFGAKINAADADAQGLIDTEGLSTEAQDRLKEMIDNDEDLVAVGEKAAQRARLGDRELRRRKQRRR